VPVVSFFGLATLGVLLACGGGNEPTSSGTRDSVTVSLSPATVAVGGAILRNATIAVVSGSAAPLQWSSENPAIATVERTGVTAAKVIAVAPGSVAIRATAGRVSATATVTVVDVAFDRLVLNGGRHACAQARDKSFFCWGDHGEGALGPIVNPEICPAQGRPCSTTPRAVTPSPAFVQVAVSHGGRTCGLTVDGVAYCWGDNADNTVGTDSEVCRVPGVVPFACIHNPTRVRGDVRFASLSLGGSLCGLTAQGAAYCWGLNNFGQLGDGTRTNRVEPTPVSGGLAFTSLSVGAGNACGLTAAGTAYCWGLNQAGQLGDGSTTERTSPVAVAGGYTFAGISIAREHACAVTVAGAAYCWGDNQFGQLGDGTTTGSTVPKAVTGLPPIVTVTAGLEHPCGLTTAGRAWCWGQNAGPQVQGQLGDGTTRSSSVPVAVARDLVFVELRAGRAFTCGRTAAGKIYCWGDNRFGQLGSGEVERLNSPTPLGVAGVP
jgi:alpha-tubulin suppressor-like RCC1 family protein